MKTMEQNFKRDIQSLGAVFNFISEWSSHIRLNKNTLREIKLAAEEIFTNMVKYNKDSPEDIKIEISSKEEKIHICLTDLDGKPFDIRKTKKYDTRQPLEKRPHGKVGLHLVKRLMDDIHYEFRDKQSKITLIKKIKGTDV
jgi:serine/threonine-protein kinase RsbW